MRWGDPNFKSISGPPPILPCPVWGLRDWASLWASP